MAYSRERDGVHTRRSPPFRLTTATVAASPRPIVAPRVHVRKGASRATAGTPGRTSACARGQRRLRKVVMNEIDQRRSAEEPISVFQVANPDRRRRRLLVSVAIVVVVIAFALG